MKKIIKILGIIMASFTLCSCKETNNLKNNLSINTTVYPIMFLTEYLYQDNANINTIYPAGVDINNYKLKAKQIKDYAQADLFIYNGLTNEKEIAKELINENKKMQIIDVSYGLKYKYGIEELWLSPNNFLMLGKNIKEYLIEFVNKKNIKQQINNNYLALEETMSMMDAELRSIATYAKKDNKPTTLVTSSNIFKYLENYGFTVISLEDEANLTSNNLNTIKSNFKNNSYDTILMLSSDKKTELIDTLINDYKAKTITVDTMYALSEDKKTNNDNYLIIMDEYIDNIRTIINE